MPLLPQQHQCCGAARGQMCISRGQKNRAANHLTISVGVVLVVVCLSRAHTSSDGAGSDRVPSRCLLWGVIFRAGSEVTEEQQVRALTAPAALLPRGAKQKWQRSALPASPTTWHQPPGELILLPITIQLLRSAEPALQAYRFPLPCEELAEGRCATETCHGCDSKDAAD